MKKNVLSLVLACVITAGSLAGCGGSGSTQATTAPAGAQETQAEGGGETGGESQKAQADSADLSETDKIIQEAQGMTMEELAKRPLRSPTERLFMAWEIPAGARVPFRCLLSISSRSIPLIPWNMNGSSRKTIRFSNSCQQIP